MSVETKMMAQWWQSPLGQLVLLEEKDLLQCLRPHFYGHFQLQVYGSTVLLPQLTDASNKIVMDPAFSLDGQAESLPFKSHSIDNVLLPHVLEFSTDPHQVLREVDRVLVADGTVVLCCFNPLSMWGLRRLFSYQDTLPWQGHYFSQVRVKDWLRLLNFEVIDVKKIMFRPPVRTDKWLARFSIMERWGKRFWPFFGGITVLVATKRTIPLTPVRLHWRYKQFFPSGRFIKKTVSRWSSKSE